MLIKLGLTLIRIQRERWMEREAEEERRERLAEREEKKHQRE